MANIVQHVVVDGLPDVSDRPLHVGRGDDLVGPRRVLVGGEDPDLSPGHLLLVDVHRLATREGGGGERHDKCLIQELWDMEQGPLIELQPCHIVTKVGLIESCRGGFHHQARNPFT